MSRHTIERDGIIIHVAFDGPEAGKARGMESMIARCVSRVCSARGISDCEAGVTLTGDKRLAGLNAKYRGVDGPTDVLSFSMLEGEFAEFSGGLLGDVVISVETAGRNAAGAGQSIEREIAMLTVHGTLHLAGLNHEGGPEEGGEMFELQESLLGDLM